MFIDAFNSNNPNLRLSESSWLRLRCSWLVFIVWPSPCRRMFLHLRWLLLLSISAGVWSVPIDRNGGNQEPKEEVQEENMVTNERECPPPVRFVWSRWVKAVLPLTPLQDTGLYYDRYLREVIEVLETDPHFREKLQTANTEDIKVGIYCQSFLQQSLISQQNSWVLGCLFSERPSQQRAGPGRPSRQDPTGWAEAAGGFSAPDAAEG